MSLTTSKMLKKRAITESSVHTQSFCKLENKQNMNAHQIKEMIDLLKAYESVCIKRQDFGGAENIKNKIQNLQGQSVVVRRSSIAAKQKVHIEQICKEGNDQIKQFQTVWDLDIQKTIEQLKQIQEQFKNNQRRQMDQCFKKIGKEKPLTIKYSPLVLEKRKYLQNLIKSRYYKLAENVKVQLKLMETKEQIKWQQKMVEKKKIQIQKLQKKQEGELKAFRLKLQSIFNEKIKERDRKFQILLKKNRKRRIQSSKPSRERILSKNGMLTSSTLQINISKHFP